MLLAFGQFLLVVAGGVAIMLLTVALCRTWMRVGSPESKINEVRTTRSKHA